MANRDLNRLKVVLAEKKRTNRWLAAELFRHDQKLCVIFFVSLHKTIPPTKKKTRATSEGIPSSIDIELLGLNDNPYFTQDFFLTDSSRPLPHNPHSGERQNGRACPQDLAR